jgi:hypothetical protein
MIVPYSLLYRRPGTAVLCYFCDPYHVKKQRRREFSTKIKVKAVVVDAVAAAAVGVDVDEYVR